MRAGTGAAYRLLTIVVLALLPGVAAAADEKDPAPADGEENASNPLAPVNNTDLKYQYLDLGRGDRHDLFVDGAYMLQPKLKLIYELHYWETNVTGHSENDVETLLLKPLYFPRTGELDVWKYRLAVGLEWIVDFNHFDKGIGSGADQLAPLVAVALSSPARGLTVIPVVQHFVSYNGKDVNRTTFRFIGIKGLPGNLWATADAKIPIDWENDNAVPASVKLQLGKMFSPHFGVFGEGLIGLGGDRPYDHGIGLGLRIKY